MSGEPEILTPPWAYYRRAGLSEMRPYVFDEDLTGISVSEPDLEFMSICAVQGRDPGGYIARNPKNHADQWYVAQAYFDENLEPLEEPVVARDEAAELRAAAEEALEAIKHQQRDPAYHSAFLLLQRAARRLRAALAASEGQP